MAHVLKYADIPDDQIRNDSDKAAVEAGHTWQPDRGKRFIDFTQRYVVPTRGPSADRNVTLMDWQHDAFMRLFSWVKPSGYRRFRSGFLAVPRQNGKSFVCSCLSLYMLVADQEPGAYVSVSACTSAQTKIVFGEVLNSVRNSPDLMKALVLRPSTNEIVYPAGNGRLKGLSSEGWGKLGDPPHLAVMDEFCFWQSYRAYEALKTGMDSRKQPLLFAISTSGTDRTTPGYDLWQYAEAVAESRIVDTAFFPAVYAAKDADDIHKPETWKLCNLSLGVTVPLEETAAWAARAKRSKVEELQFRQYRLNQWTTSVNQFLDLDAWAKCKVEAKDWPDLSGQEAWLSLDLSATRDLTSVVAVVPHDGRYYVDHKSFCCSEGVKKAEAENVVKYSLFAKEGTLVEHDGDCVDYDDVRAYVRTLTKKYKVKCIAVDPTRNANDTMLMFQNDGLPVVPYRPGPLYFNAPMLKLEEWVLAKKLAHKGDSLLNWQAQNLEAKKDYRDLIQPTKPSAVAKIDTMVSLLMSVAKCVEGQAVPEKPADNKIEWW